MEYDTISSPIFVVQKAEDDVTVPYTGRMSSRALPAAVEEAQSEFITLNGGETITVEVDVSKGYQLEANSTYEVSLDAFLNFFEGTFDELVKKTHKTKLLSSTNSNSSSGIPLSLAPLTSQVVQIFSQHASKPHLQMGFNPNCNQDIRNRFWALYSPASQNTNNALSYLQRAQCDFHYNLYFGFYQGTNRWATASWHFQNIKRNIDIQSFAITCETTCQQYVVAFVYPNDRSHLIHLCAWLFQQPVDFQGSTLIHELAHFDDVAGTRDHGYGEEAARNLARTNPDMALNNAENHGLFAKIKPYC